jgi:hypothetical protein
MGAKRKSRWWETRAERMTAAVIELTLEVHGHDGLLERLSNATWGHALGAAVGLGDAAGRRAVTRLLQRALDPTDAARLSLAIGDGTAKLPDGRRVDLMAVDGERVVALAPRRPLAPQLDPERRLGALQLVAHGSTATDVGLGHRLPGRGPREVVALGLLADLVIELTPDPRLLSLTFGGLDAPSGVLVAVLDRVLADLEALLHSARPAASRATPLLWLRAERERLERRAQRYGFERFAARERRFAADLAGRTRDDSRPVARPPRRPKRRSFRDLDWVPPAFEPPRRALDLFLP